MALHPTRESDLYAPVKAYLEAQGYEVKAEIGACDLLAVRGDEEPVVVELKLTFSLALVMQGVARQTVFDQVYLAVPASSERGWKLRYKDIIRLCRRLGLGLLAVRFSSKGAAVEAHLDPGPYAPRKNAKKRGQLLKEFERRAGDPNKGGVTGVKTMTSYRQDALRLARYLANHPPCTPAALKRETGVDRAQAILAANHYGWFDKVARGIYTLSPTGEAAARAPECPIADDVAPSTS